MPLAAKAGDVRSSKNEAIVIPSEARDLWWAPEKGPSRRSG
jgi:hypothetical protein